MDRCSRLWLGKTLMKSIRLVKPTMAYKDQIEAYRQAFLDSGESLSGTSGLRDYEHAEDWIKHVMLGEQKLYLPKDKVPATQYLCITEDNIIIGMINIRHELNDYLMKYGGHIGYSVHPDYRKQGYAKAQLGLALDECQQFDLKNVLITCNQSNLASSKTILAHGGVLENEIPEEGTNEIIRRYWITIKE